MDLADELILTRRHVELASKCHDVGLLGLNHRNVFARHDGQLFSPNVIICRVPDIADAEIPRPIHEVMSRGRGLRCHDMFHPERDLILLVNECRVEMNYVRLFPGLPRYTIDLLGISDPLSGYSAKMSSGHRSSVIDFLPVNFRLELNFWCVVLTLCTGSRPDIVPMKKVNVGYVKKIVRH